MCCKRSKTNESRALFFNVLQVGIPVMLVNPTHEVVVSLYYLLLFTFAVVYEVKKMENPYKRKLLSQEDDDEGDRPNKRRGQDKKKQKACGLKTNEANQ
jgi:hypothetical protein